LTEPVQLSYGIARLPPYPASFERDSARMSIL
jgi:hypothetical protein